METDLEIREFVDCYKGKKVTSENIDDFVLPDSKDEVSTKLLHVLSKEKSIEDTLDVLKTDFRRKRMDIETYLRVTRELSERQFMNIAKKHKITNFIEVHGGARR